MGKRSVHTILHDSLQYRKAFKQWVPKLLTQEQKNYRMGVSMEHLMRYHEIGNHLLSWVITDDEAWCYHFNLTIKHMSMKRRHLSFLRPRNAHSSLTVGKIMLGAFRRRWHIVDSGHGC